MKKSRILVLSVLAAGAISLSAVAFGCAHKHSFSSEWSKDETNHWHAATCHEDVKEDEAKHTYDAEYKCTVCDYQHVHSFNEAFECTGCDYKLADISIAIKKNVTEYSLDGAQTMNVPMDDFSVCKVKENGELGEEVSSNDYTLKYFKGATAIANLNGVGEGAYNVWAEATVNGKLTESFAVIYILDEVQSIEFKGGTVEQEAGDNVMSSTWKYTVTYKSGRTEDIGADDNKLKLSGVATNKETTEGKATVSYTVKNVKGKEKTVECEVPYTIKEASGIKVETTVFSADNLTVTAGNTTEDLTLVEGVLTAKSGIAVDENKKSYTDETNEANNRSYTQRLKLNGAGNPTSKSVEVIVAGKAKIVVYAMSSSGSADRQLVLAKSTYTKWIDTPEEIVGTPQTCLGASLTRVEYEVAEAGTYYLVSTSGGINIYGVEVSVEIKPAEPVVFSADNLTLTTGNTTEDLTLSEGALTAKSGIAVDENKKSYTDETNEANNRSYTQRLKLNGAGNPTSKSVEVKLTGKAKIVVYAMSSSGSADRQLVLAKSTYTKWIDTPEEIVGTPQTCLGASLTRVEYEVAEAGTYYLVSTSGGINIYGIEIIYN